MTEKENVWVVSGSTGEYSGRLTWLVSAHATEEAAKAECNRLMALYREACKDRRKLKKTMREHDPQFEEEHNGTEYYETRVPARFGVVEP